MEDRTGRHQAGLTRRADRTTDLERHRAFVASSRDGIWRLEFDPPIDVSLPVDAQIDLAYRSGQFVEGNEAMARMHGLATADDLIGKGLELMLPASNPEARESLTAIVEAGFRVTDLESVQRDSSGRTRHFATTIVATIEGDRVVRLWGTQRDISERKALDAALRASEARYRELVDSQAYLAAIVESTDDAIISKDLNGIIRFANPAAERVFGYTPAELRGKPIRMLIPAERQSEEDDILARLRRGERIEHFETVRVRKDGRRIDISLTISPVRDASGAIVGASKIARDITGQRRAAETQAYLAAIVSSSDDAILSKDLDGIIQTANASAERVFGYSIAELVGQPVRMLIPPELQYEEDEILARLRRGDRIDHFETVRVTKDGRRINISLTVSPVRDESGRIIGVSKVARDITEQKRAAAELAAQQAWFRITLGSIGDGVIASDPAGLITYMNAAAEQLTGWPLGDAVGRPLTEVFHIVNEKTRRTVENPAALVMRTGQIVGLANHTVLVARDGAEYPIADSAAPIVDQQQRIIGVVLVFRDVSDERRAEEVVAEQREWFETTLESIGDAVIATDVRGRVVFINSVAERLTGWTADAAQGRPSSDVFRIVDEDSDRPADDPVTRVLADGATVSRSNHILLRSADGTVRPIEDSGSPIRNRDGRTVGAVLVFRDVSERRRAEMERVTASSERERLLEAERVARSEAERASRVKDEFVAMVSHELRTPLNAILGWTELMMHGKDDPRVLDRGLEIVARNTRVQAQLISDLLDISRIVAGKLQLEIQNADLPSILDDAIEIVQRDAQEKRIEVTREVAAGMGPVAGDPARLQQVIWNLLSNAIKFTPEGGSVSAALRRRGPFAEITVTDNGAGIRPEFLPHVFDRFHQADRSTTRRYGGLGLGLSIVKHLVELHGGSVRAESAGEGHGSTFTVLLPGSPLRTPVARPIETAFSRAPEANASLDGIRILVVEDEPDTREFLVRLLSGQGAEVVAAGTARQALALFEQQPADIIVSDIGLPELDGYDLIRKIREVEKRGDVPAIALTAYARSEDRTRALRAGFQGHLAKPVEPVELIATVESFRGVIQTQQRRR